MEDTHLIMQDCPVPIFHTILVLLQTLRISNKVNNEGAIIYIFIDDYNLKALNYLEVRHTLSSFNWQIVGPYLLIVYWLSLILKQPTISCHGNTVGLVYECPSFLQI